VKVRVLKHVAYRVGDREVFLRPGQVAEVPDEVVERNPGWFDPVKEPKKKTTQQKEAAKR